MSSCWSCSRGWRSGDGLRVSLGAVRGAARGVPTEACWRPARPAARRSPPRTTTDSLSPPTDRGACALASPSPPYPAHREAVGLQVAGGDLDSVAEQDPELERVRPVVLRRQVPETRRQPLLLRLGLRTRDEHEARLAGRERPAVPRADRAVRLAVRRQCESCRQRLAGVRRDRDPAQGVDFPRLQDTSLDPPVIKAGDLSR